MTANTKTTNKMSFTMIWSLVFALLFVSCSDKRPIELTDEQKENLFEVKDLYAADFVVTLESRPEASSERQHLPLHTSDEVAKLRVQAINGDGDARLARILQDAWVNGRPGEEIRVFFDFTIIDGNHFITAYRVVESGQEEHLSLKERILLMDKRGEQVIPLFNYSIVSVGSLERITNELGEETRRVRVRPTPLEVATHFQVRSLAEDKQKVGLDALPDRDRERVFIVDNINGKFFPAWYVKQVFGINLQVEDDIIVYFEVNSDSNKLEIFTISSEEELDADAQIALQIGDSTGDYHPHVQRCDEGIIQAAGVDSCAKVARFETNINYVQIKPREDRGFSNWSAPYTMAARPNETSLIEIEVHDTPRTIDSIDYRRYDPRQNIRVKDFQGKEFVFRRTVSDTPNMFNFMFPGLSGRLMIVQFHFEEENVVLKRSRPLLAKQGTNDTDIEVLFSLPVKYYKEILFDSVGNLLKTPRRVETNYRDPEAIANIDWSNSQIQRAGSVLYAWGIADVCFTNKARQNIENVKLDRRDGMYGFTYSQTFTANRMCRSRLSNDMFEGYWTKEQESFTFKERFSFKEYKGQDSEEPLLSVPYEQQKRLGFGLFTYHNFIPNEYGNTQYVGSRQALPAVFNLRPQRSHITYVLAGIPREDQDAELRRRLIIATIESIEDVDKAFRMAFKDTPYERPVGPEYKFVKLQVQGLSPSEVEEYSQYGVRNANPGELGDFDKNYIYYVQKGTQSTVIGLGGSHHNPYSGKVEAASSFVYGGNIKSYVEFIRRREQARAEYREKKGLPAEDVSVTEAQNREILAGNAQANPHGRTILGIDDFALRQQASDFEARVAQTLGQQFLQQGMQSLAAHSTDHSHEHHHREQEPLVYTHNLEENFNRDNALRTFRRLKTRKSVINFQQAFGQSGVNSMTTPLRRAANLYTAFHKLVEDGHKNNRFYLNDSRRITAALDENYGYLNDVQDFYDEMEKRNFCIHDYADMATQAFSKGIPEDVSDTDLLIAVYKPTLVHEIGHNIGLRHNFIASFDKDNWKFHEDEQTKRNYSSIMDYTPDTYEAYDGMGPYDVHAIRAAYTGLVELDRGQINNPSAAQEDAEPFDYLPSIASSEGDNDGEFLVTTFQDRSGAEQTARTPIVGGRFIPIDKIPEITGLNDWVNLDTDTLRKLGLKEYMYCSDEEAGWYPTCNRHDLGSSPEGIVDQVIKDYYELYELSAYRNDRIYFRRWGVDNWAYTGRLFRLFSTARQFLEESIYRLVWLNEDFNRDVLPYLQASMKAYNFLIEVIRQPDATDDEARANDRFESISIPGQGEIVVEKKPPRDVDHDNINYQDLATRGAEIDKVISLIFLTERYVGSPRYAGRGLVFSYYTLESWFDQQGQWPANSQLLGIVGEMLENNIRPQVVANGTPYNLPARFETRSTLMMKYYAALAGSVSLNITQGADNPADMFRVMTSFNKPANGRYVIEPGMGEDDLKYWTTDRSLVTNKLIQQIQAMSLIHDNPSVQQDLAQWYVLRQQSEQKDTRHGEKSERLKTVEAQLNQKVSTLPAHMQPQSDEELFKTANAFFGDNTLQTFLVQWHRLKEKQMDSTTTLTNLEQQQLAMLEGRIETMAQDLPIAPGPHFFDNLYEMMSVYYADTTMRNLLAIWVGLVNAKEDLEGRRSDVQTQLGNLESRLNNVIEQLPSNVRTRSLDGLYKRLNDFLSLMGRVQDVEGNPAFEQTIKNFYADSRGANLRWAYDDPLYVYTISALNGEELGLPGLSEVQLTDRELGFNRDGKFDSLQYLSMFFYLVNPNYVGQ